jgi:hypothetical protein
MITTVGVRGGVERGGGLVLTLLGQRENQGISASSPRVSARPPPRSTPPLTPTGPHFQFLVSKNPTPDGSSNAVNFVAQGIIRYGEVSLFMRKNTRTKYSVYSHRQPATSVSVQSGLVVGIVLLCALLLVCGVGKSMAATRSLPPGPGTLNHPKGWCGQQEQPACRLDFGWLPVASEQPDEIARVMMSSSGYAMLQKSTGYFTLDTPVRVHSLNTHTGIAYYDLDHWIASARSTTGMRVGLFDFVYDAPYKRIRFSSFGVIQSQDAHAHMAFPYIMGNQALARLQAQPGVHMLAESQPELVFFLIDPRYNDLRSKKYRWYGGGNSPMNPLWHIAGVAGNDYFVGSDLHTYTKSMVKPLMVR